MKLKLYLIAALATVLAGCHANNKTIGTDRRPDYNAISKAAYQAGRQFMTQLSPEARANNIIPRQFWGQAIEELNPIRVEFDRVNVVIVMKDNEHLEEGYYFIPMISSYLPFDKKDVTFEELTSREDVAMAAIPGDLAYYKKLKN